jgi:hypothetical protein
MGNERILEKFHGVFKGLDWFLMNVRSNGKLGRHGFCFSFSILILEFGSS